MYANNSVSVSKLNIRSETKYISPHFRSGRFCFRRFGVWPVWTFTVAVLVWFVALLVVAVLDVGLIQNRSSALHAQIKK